MAKKILSIIAVGFGISLLLATIAATPAHAQTETVLHTFAGPYTGGSGADGATPFGGLVSDASGNLYGTTGLGGADGYGTVFELVNTSGSYTEKVLYSFAGPPGGISGADGVQPQAGLLRDAAGDLFGTTVSGGNAGAGIVFELVNASGSYTETILHDFGSLTSGDAETPSSSLTMDSFGNLYGTTYGGGAKDEGTVYELVKSQTYAEEILYSFLTNGSTDPTHPNGGVLLDPSCDLFGTAQSGGTFLAGAVYELVNSTGSCASAGSYTEEVLHSFAAGGSDGFNPLAGLIADASGNLYGTTSGGGTGANGTVYELVNSSGAYTEKILYNFTGAGGDGAVPEAPLLMDSSGDLFGTDTAGGSTGYGAIFELVYSKASRGKYTEKVLYSFNGASGDGIEPYYGGLIADSAGNLYGTTLQGGAYGWGIAFKLSVTTSSKKKK